MKPHKAFDIRENRDTGKIVRDARKAEKAGKLDLRDQLANEVFQTPNARLVTNGTRTVDTFWDIKTQSFITQIRVGGKEVVPSVFSRKAQAPIAHLWGLYSLWSKDVS